MLSWYTADLHVHTVLSPCAELSMGPRNIVRKALESDIDIIAGMEVYVREGANMICLLPDIERAMVLQKFVYDHLPPGVAAT